MLKAFFSILFFLLIPLQGFCFSLKESLEDSHSGDYIVYEASRLYTVIHVRAKSGRTIVMEEIVIGTDCLKSQQKGFAEWLQEGALNNASWMIYEVDLKRGAIVKNYSKTKQVQGEPGEGSFLSTLLLLDFHSAIASWSPPLPKGFEGCSKKWVGQWPIDGSPLSKADLSCFTALSPFPYWIELKKDQKRIVMRAVDKGRVINNPIKS